MQMIHSPKVKCYKCLSEDIQYICHHCGRAMCEEHKEPTETKDGKLLSQEFTDLESEGGEAAYHCKDCQHIIRMPIIYPSVLGLIFTVALMLFSESGIRDSMLYLIIGLIYTFVSLYVFYFHRTFLILRRCPELPLFAICKSVSMKETLGGTIKMDDKGVYEVSDINFEGKLKAAAKWSEDAHKRLKKYREKYKCISSPSIRVHAGFIAFKEKIDIDLDNDDLYTKRGMYVIPLQKRLNDLFPNPEDRKADAEIPYSFDYHYEDPKKLAPKDFPVRIVPALVRNSARKVLELVILWGKFLKDGNSPHIKHIKTLKVEAPETWGDVKGEDAIVDGSLNGTRTIIWNRPEIDECALENQQRIFRIETTNPIKYNMKLKGEVEIIFKSYFTEIEGIELFYPVGSKSSCVSENMETTVKASFELDLHALLYQQQKLVPDNVRDRNDLGQIFNFPGIVPNHDSIIQLTNELARNKFYIQRVVEEFPRTGQRAQQVNRSWDITGRYYNHIYPIDFHLIVSGEEWYSTKEIPENGNTKIALNVNGFHLNPEMENKIKLMWFLILEICINTWEATHVYNKIRLLIDIQHIRQSIADLRATLNKMKGTE